MGLPNISSSSSGLDAGIASAANGVVQATLGYQLTKQSLNESEAFMIFPLIALSGEAIIEGIGTYIAVQESWDTINKNLIRQFQTMTHPLIRRSP